MQTHDVCYRRSGKYDLLDIEQDISKRGNFFIVCVLLMPINHVSNKHFPHISQELRT